MISMLASVIGQRGVDAMAFLLAFALTALTDSIFRDKLPHDHGRAFAVNGELSKGKARGSGLIFVLCIALVSLALAAAGHFLLAWPDGLVGICTGIGAGFLFAGLLRWFMPDACDAGTPAISDPGARLVQAVQAAGLRVMPIPGASSVIAALSASGADTVEAASGVAGVDGGWVFAGFLPAKGRERQQALQALQAVMQFIQVSRPPREVGMMCSRVRVSKPKRPPQ